MDGSGFLDLRIGDRVEGLDGAAPIFAPGPARWYALRVRPQKEAAAEIWLKRRGVYGFHPVVRRVSRRFGKAFERRERYLPGYVFACFDGEPVPHLVTAGPFVTGAICRKDGDWGVLEGDELVSLHRMRAVDAKASALRAEAVHRERQKHRVRAGGGAMFRSGVFAGKDCEVIEIKAAGRAVVRLQLFGREAVFEADERDLVARRGLTDESPSD